MGGPTAARRQPSAGESNAHAVHSGTDVRRAVASSLAAWLPAGLRPLPPAGRRLHAAGRGRGVVSTDEALLQLRRGRDATSVEPAPRRLPGHGVQRGLLRAGRQDRDGAREDPDPRGRRPLEGRGSRLQRGPSRGGRG